MNRRAVFLFMDLFGETPVKGGVLMVNAMVAVIEARKVHEPASEITGVVDRVSWIAAIVLNEVDPNDAPSGPGVRDCGVEQKAFPVDQQENELKPMKNDRFDHHLSPPLRAAFSHAFVVRKFGANNGFSNHGCEQKLIQ